MKWLLTSIMLLLCAGCAPTVYRTGTISVSKFTFDAETNRNPIQISNEAVENIRAALESNLIRMVKEETKMKVVQGGCQKANFELVGKITKLDGEIDHHYRFVMVTHNNKYTIETEGFLVDCKTGKPVVEFSQDNDRENIMDAIENVSEHIAKDVR